jgi:hypothetical protein
VTPIAQFAHQMSAEHAQGKTRMASSFKMVDACQPVSLALQTIINHELVIVQ